MTVSTTSRLAGPFTGTGTQAVLPFAFKVFAAADILVIRGGDPLTLTTNYSVALNSDQNAAPGGTVTILAAANTLNAAVYVTAATSIAQGTSLPSQGPWSPRIIEAALDRVTIIAQEHEAMLARSVLVPLQDTGGTLPAAADRASKFLAFDAAGAPTTLPGTADETLREDLAKTTGAAQVNTSGGITLQAKLNALDAADVADRARANHTGTQPIATILAAATARFFGRFSASGGAGEELTGTQATTLLDVATGALKGLMSAAHFTKISDLPTNAALQADLIARPTAAALLADDGSMIRASATLTVKQWIAQLLTSAGATLVGFIQAGTGAFARPLQEKLRERLSINDFTGADPSGVADSTAAINAAITRATALGGAEIYVDGKYLYNSTIIVPTRIRFVGHGSTSDSASGNRAASCFIKNFSGLGFSFTGDDSGASYVQFDRKSGVTDTGDNVQLVGSRSFLDYCTASNAGGNGVRVGSDAPGVNTNLWRLTMPICLANGGHGLYITDPVGSPDANAGYVIGGDMRSNGGDGVRADYVYWAVFVGVNCQNNGGVGFRVTGNARALNIVGGDLEANLDSGAPVPRQGLIENGALGISIDSPLNLVGLWTNLAPAGAGKIREYSPGVLKMTDGDEINIINKRSSAATMCNFFNGPNEANVASIRGVLDGSTGGALNFLTKLDGFPTLLPFLTTDNKQRSRFWGAVQTAYLPLTYSASIAVDAALANAFQITPNNTSAFTIQDPTNAPAQSQIIHFRIRNTGISMGAISWGSSYKLATLAAPASSTQVTIWFEYDGANWVECARSGAIPI